MSYIMEGSIKLIEGTQTFKGDFKKREFVIKTHDTYPQEVKFELTGDSVDYLDNFTSGDNVKIAFLVRGNEYNGKHYVNLRAIAVGFSNEDNGVTEQLIAKPKIKPIITEFDETDDDLPF